MNRIVRIPPDLPVYWAGDYSICMPDGSIERFIRNHIATYTRRVDVQFARCDGITTYTHQSTAFPTIVALLAIRGVSHPSFALLPLDDETFDHGLVRLEPYKTDWSTKKPIAFWRGGASGQDRPTLRQQVTSALYYHPSSDVRIARSWGWENGKGIPDHHLTERCPIRDWFHYKYILIVDGYMIASNHQWVFGSGSVPIMVTHPNNDYWFKRYLKAGVHYISVSYDLSDINEKLDWLVSHDDEAHEIAKNAMHFAKTVFSPEFQRWHLRHELDRVVNSNLSILDLHFQERCATPSDINQHLVTLQAYAARCKTVVECGVRHITSSYAFATALKAERDNQLVMVDPERSPDMDRFLSLCLAEGVNATFYEESDLECPLVATELLFIDTWHVYGQLRRELARWQSSVSRYIIMHDTTVDEWEGETIRCGFDAERQSEETGIPVEEIRKGLWPAVAEFLEEHPEWKVERRDQHNNGLTVLSR